MTGRLILPLVLALLAAFSVWLVRGVGPSATPQLSSSEGRDFFMEQVTSIETDIDGKPRYRLQADQLNHFPQGMRTELNQPALQVYQANGEHWLILADKANAENNDEQINLQHNVTLQRPGTKGDVLIKTQFITVKPGDNIAQTKHKVSIQQGESRIDGLGLEAQLDSEVITILSDVRGHYVLPNR